MKTGLMSCYVDNYGACLQAYALQSAIESSGSECEIIKYTPYADLIRTTSYGANSEEEASVKIKRAIAHPVKFMKRRNFTQNSALRSAKFESFRNSYLKFGDKLYESWDELRKDPPEYDNFVCGSDQIWNPVIHHNTNVGPYFLDFVPEGKKRIAYAPSIGVEKIPEECRSEMKEFLEKFDTLSVREQHGAELIKELSALSAPVVLDPTLLFDGKWWSEVCHPVTVKKPYILCYLFNENPSTFRFVEFMKRKTGFDVVTLPQTFSDVYNKNIKIYDAGPAEFIWLIKNAELIITDSFHATAFSINFNKRFYCLRRNTTGEKNNMNSRITSILSLAGLEDRLIDNPDEGCKLPPNEIDYRSVNLRMAERRKRDLNFLKTALGAEV